MNENSIEALTSYLGWLVISWVQGLHAASACGAAFGCFALIAFPEPTNQPRLRKVSLLVFSWGVGYSLGTAAAGSDAPWNSMAMFVAISGAAFAAAMFGSVNLMIRNDGPLPKWLALILDRVPFLKSRNSTDDSH